MNFESEKQKPVAWIVDGEIKVRLDMAGKLYYSETNVYAAPVIAEAEKQEPVAYVSGYHGGNCVVTPINPAVVFSVGTAFSYTAPVHASDISQERVDETAKREHDLVGACVTCGAPHGFWLSAPPTNFISPSVVKAISKREWVGLTEQDIHDAFQFTELVKQLSFSRERQEWCENFAAYLEAKLKEKNHG